MEQTVTGKKALDLPTVQLLSFIEAGDLERSLAVLRQVVVEDILERSVKILVDAGHDPFQARQLCVALADLLRWSDFRALIQEIIIAEGHHATEQAPAR